MSSSSFHKFIYARSEQCDLCPIYTITNTQRIRIYPGILKFILVKISPDQGRLHGKDAKENQTLFTFLTIENLSGLRCSHECKYGAYSDLFSYAVNSVSGQNPPGQNPPDKIPLDKIPLDKIPPRTKSPRTKSPWTKSPWTKSPHYIPPNCSIAQYFLLYINVIF